MSTTCRVTISLDVGERQALDLYDVLTPDNVDFPDGLTAEVRAADKTAIIEVYSDKNLAQVTGTVDEILSHTQMALDVVEDGSMTR